MEVSVTVLAFGGPKMSAREELFVRGYRPGSYGLPSLEELQTERILKRGNIQRYAKRAKARLPLFEESRTPEPPSQDAGAGTSS